MDAGDLLKRVSEASSAGRAYGPAIERDDCLIIPTAWVVNVGGAGYGGGSPEDPSGEHSSGGGGGFTGVTWPLGVYVVKNGDVRWVPALDVTRLVVAGLAFARHLVKRRSRHHARGA